jgi:hypothetical protein
VCSVSGPRTFTDLRGPERGFDGPADIPQNSVVRPRLSSAVNLSSLGIPAESGDTPARLQRHDTLRARRHARMDSKARKPHTGGSTMSVVPPMALIAPFARVTWSTNRSTPYHGDHRMPATERYRRSADHRMPAPGGIRPPKEGPPLLTAEPLDLECRRNMCRASRRPLEIRRIRSGG